MISIEKLKGLELFQDLSAAALEKLGAGMDERSFSPGDVILKEGDSSGALYVIASGSVSIQKKLDKSGEKSKVVAKLSANEFFGEMSLLENQTHSASVVAEDPTIIFTLPRKSLDHLIEKDAGTAINHVLTLMAGISGRLRHTTKELVTVFEVARLMGQEAPLVENVGQALKQLQVALGDGVSIGFYRWNFFNDEYELFVSEQVAGSSPFKPTIEKESPTLRDSASFIVSRVDHLRNREGLFLYSSPKGFDSGGRQLIETISAMIAPALATARTRDEEISRLRLAQGKQKEHFQF